jgi:ferric enterobactin receptor
VNKAFLIALFCFTALAVRAQHDTVALKVNEVFHRVPLSKALKKIQEKYDVRVAYDNALVQHIIINVVLSDVSLDQAFHKLLQGTSLEFNKVGENIIIVPKPSVSNVRLTKMDFTIAGVIMDAQTGETLPNAVIRISGTNLATQSNNDGYFAIHHIPSDTLGVTISYMGYLTQAIALSQIGDPSNVHVRMKDDTKILSEVAIMDEYNHPVHVETTAGEIAFNPRSLNTLPSMGEQDIFRTMQLMPGVNATDESSAGMPIRGMHPGYNLVLVDGITIYQQDHFFGAFSIINSDIIKDSHVHRGIFDPRFGGRTSGVIDITSKNGNTEKPAFSASVNPIALKGTAELPISKKFSLFLAGRRSFTDLIQSGLYEDLFTVAKITNDQIQLFRLNELFGATGTEPKYFFYDINAKLSYKPSERDIISLSSYNSGDRMKIRDSLSFSADDFFFSLRTKEVTHWGNRGLSLRWGRQWNEQFYSNLRMSDSEFFKEYAYDQKFVFDTLRTVYQFITNGSIGDQTIALENEGVINNSLSVDFGISAVRQRTLSQIEGGFSEGYEEEDPDEDEDDSANLYERSESWLTSFYENFHINLTSKFKLSVGSRLNYYNLTHRAYFEPRATVNYKMNDNLNLKMAYGKSHQFINQYLYYGTQGTLSAVNENFWILSASFGDYPVVSTYQSTAGFTFTTNRFTFDAELYYKTSRGLIFHNELSAGHQIAYGADLMVQKTTGIHKGWIAYSISNNLQSSDSFQGGKYYSSLSDQRHQVKVINMIMLGSWNLSSTFILGSGKPFPKYNVTYFHDANGNIELFELTPDHKNSHRLPPYFRLDFAASYKFKSKGRAVFEAGASILNVTDHANLKTRMVDIYSLDEAIGTSTPMPVSYIDVKLMKFTPSLFLTVSF